MKGISIFQLSVGKDIKTQKQISVGLQSLPCFLKGNIQTNIHTNQVDSIILPTAFKWQYYLQIRCLIIMLFL